MTLTDCRGKVIISKSAAIVIGKLERRRRRKAPQTIEPMIASLQEYFDLHNILTIKLMLHVRPGPFLYNIVSSLTSRHLKLAMIFNRRKLPFSFTRGRRKRY